MLNISYLTCSIGEYVCPRSRRRFTRCPVPYGESLWGVTTVKARAPSKGDGDWCVVTKDGHIKWNSRRTCVQSIQCNAMQSHAEHCSVGQCIAGQCSAVHCSAVQCNTIQKRLLRQKSSGTRAQRYPTISSRLSELKSSTGEWIRCAAIYVYS